MKIDLTELLKETGNEMEVDDKALLSYPEDGIEINDPIDISTHLINAGEEVIITGRIKAQVGLLCSRCLKPIKAILNIKIDERFSKKEALTGMAPIEEREVELSESDFVFPIEKDDTIDLTEMIRQNLLSELPIQPLCSKTCKGLDDKHETAKKLDPRLEKLKEFKARKNKED